MPVYLTVQFRFRCLTRLYELYGFQEHFRGAYLIRAYLKSVFCLCAQCLISCILKDLQKAKVKSSQLCNLAPVAYRVRWTHVG